MINKKVEDAINQQINAETYSEYLYLSMSAYFESINLKGFASWMKIQAQEEHSHAIKFFNHIIERGGRVKLTQINEPAFEWKNPLEAFSNAYKHELEITNKINKIYDLSINEKDHAATVMLQWFINEQVEEEANADEIVQKLKMIGESKGSLVMFDKQLGKRGKE